MIWASSVGAVGQKIPDLPCAFNSLCTCSNGNFDNYGNVKCADVPFSAIPGALNMSKVYTLKMENTGLVEIEEFSLAMTALYRLEISHNPIFNIDQDAFKGLERSLWHLILNYNELVTIPTEAIRILSKLQYLDLTGNSISIIEPNSFRGLQQNLQTLILADNSINTLTMEDFQGLPNLVTLDLSSNNLHEISPDVFREQMNSLSKVILADNLLTEIPYVQVSMLKVLKHLDLSKNQITSFKIFHDDQPLNVKLSLEQLHLEHNQIYRLTSASFQYFLSINQTFLDFNPIHQISDDAFQQARIRELYMRHCQLEFIEPSAFSGLESTLQVLDMSGNNITTLPDKLFNSFDLLRTLNLKDNKVLSIYPHSTTFTSFQYSLLKLDLTGDRNGPTNLQEIRRLKNLRTLAMGKFGSEVLTSESFLEFGIELENLKIYHAGLRTIKAHAFQNVRGIKRLDLSENRIDLVEKAAFTDIGHSLLSLKITHGFAGSVTHLPDLRELTSVEELDFSNNKIKTISDIAFHTMKNLRTLKMNDNQIDQLPKGIFQRDFHQKLEEVSFEFNNLRHISTHTFVDLEVNH
jgi:Leucine-rich repeat (LRR) protein